MQYSTQTLEPHGLPGCGAMMGQHSSAVSLQSSATAIRVNTSPRITYDTVTRIDFAMWYADRGLRSTLTVCFVHAESIITSAHSVLTSCIIQLRVILKFSRTPRLWRPSRSVASVLRILKPQILAESIPFSFRL